MLNWEINLPDGSTQYPMDVSHNKNEVCIDLRCPCDGETTKNSKFPRCELREMVNGEKAKWSSSKGVHKFKATFVVGKLPSVKPEVCVFQIHDGSNDRLQLIVSGDQLIYKFENVKFPLGRHETAFRVECTVRDDYAFLRVNEMRGLRFYLKSDSLFFKTGNYMQSNLEIEKDENVYSLIKIYELAVHHE